MMSIDELITIIQNLILYRGRVTFTHPEYRKFHDGIIKFVYGNHFEETPEWKNIKKYLLINSNQFMTNDEADCILQNLRKLKRLAAKNKNTTVVCYCNNCKIKSKHLVLSYIADKGYDDESGVGWADKYQIIRCDNCNTILILHQFLTLDIWGFYKFDSWRCGRRLSPLEGVAENAVGGWSEGKAFPFGTVL